MAKKKTQNALPDATISIQCRQLKNSAYRVIRKWTLPESGSKGLPAEVLRASLCALLKASGLLEKHGYRE
jgi:hypothetical protein